MSLEERIRQSVGNALDDVRARMEAEVRAIAQELMSSAAEERQAAIASAHESAAADARRGIEAEIAEAEARAQAAIDERVAEARALEREQVTLELRDQLTAEAHERLRAATAESDARLAAALAEADERRRAEADAAEVRAAEAINQSVAAAHVGEREYEMAGLSRLLDAVRGLDGATSLSDVLDVLGAAAGRETGRAALVVVKGDRIQGWKLAGFGTADAAPRSVDLALSDAGIIGGAVSGNRAVITHEGQDGRAPAFAGLPGDRIGMAVPVLVGGRAVAVLYADTAADLDREVAVPSGWPEVIEILARHAGRCLEALTAQRAAQTPTPRFWVPSGGKPVSPQSHTVPPPSANEAMSAVEPEAAARRLARLLLSEIKLYHEAAVREARRTRTLIARLGPEIERARRTYDTRIPASLATRAELFHQELVATLAGGDPSRLGVPA